MPATQRVIVLDTRQCFGRRLAADAAQRLRIPVVDSEASPRERLLRDGRRVGDAGRAGSAGTWPRHPDVRLLAAAGDAKSGPLQSQPATAEQNVVDDWFGYASRRSRASIRSISTKPRTSNCAWKARRFLSSVLPRERTGPLGEPALPFRPDFLMAKKKLSMAALASGHREVAARRPSTACCGCDISSLVAAFPEQRKNGRASRSPPSSRSRSARR